MIGQDFAKKGKTAGIERFLLLVIVGSFVCRLWCCFRLPRRNRSARPTRGMVLYINTQNRPLRYGVTEEKYQAEFAEELSRAKKRRSIANTGGVGEQPNISPHDAASSEKSIIDERMNIKQEFSFDDDAAYADAMAEDDTPQGLAKEDSEISDYDALAREVQVCPYVFTRCASIQMELTAFAGLTGTTL